MAACCLRLTVLENVTCCGLFCLYHCRVKKNSRYRVFSTLEALFNPAFSATSILSLTVLLSSGCCLSDSGLSDSNLSGIGLSDSGLSNSDLTLNFISLIYLSLVYLSEPSDSNLSASSLSDSGLFNSCLSEFHHLTLTWLWFIRVWCSYLLVSGLHH